MKDADNTLMLIGEENDGNWSLENPLCPACGRRSFYLRWGGKFDLSNPKKNPNNPLAVEYEKPVRDIGLVYPRMSKRPPAPKEVPASVGRDYDEACLILNDSPKASAALSRRCLQNILLQKAGVKKGDLSKQIQEVLDARSVPSYISESLDAVRNIGNFAAHPIKSKSTGEIVDVEPGEAEWNLEVIESLFDFYYVQPDKVTKRKAALNEKLKDAGKPEMK